MDCKRAREIIDFYIDGEITQEEKEALEEHLKTCISCKIYYEDISKLHNILSGGNYLKPREGFTEGVIARLPRRRRLFSWMPKPVLVGVFSLIIILIFAFVKFPLFDFNKKEFAEKVKVQFMLNLQNAEAKTVSIVGDFNDWQVGKDILSDPDGDGIWVGEITLKPGKYQYVFVIDGKKWIPDPRAKEVSRDGFGGVNSVIEVKKRFTK